METNTTQLTFDEVKAFIMENWSDKDAISGLVGKTITGVNNGLIDFHWGNTPTEQCWINFAKSDSGQYNIIERIRIWSGDGTWTGFGWKMHMGYNYPKVDVGVNWRDILNKSAS